MVDASAIRAMATNRSKQPSTPRCTHYQKVGHEQSQYFEIISYLPNWQGRWANRGNQLGSRSDGKGFTDGVRDGGSGSGQAGFCPMGTSNKAIAQGETLTRTTHSLEE